MSIVTLFIVIFTAVLTINVCDSDHYTDADKLSTEPVGDTITVIRVIDNGYIINRVVQDPSGKFRVTKTEVRE